MNTITQNIVIAAATLALGAALITGFTAVVGNQFDRAEARAAAATPTLSVTATQVKVERITISAKRLTV